MSVYDTPFVEAVQRKEGVYDEDLVVRLFKGSEVKATVRRSRGPVYQARDGRQSLTLPLPMGEFVLFNGGLEGVVLGASHSNRFDLYDASGQLVRTMSAEGTPRRATAADMAAFDAKTRRRRSGPVAIRGMVMPSADVRIERYLDHAPRGDYVPMFDQVEIGTGGHLWVREYVLDRDDAIWQVLAPETGGPVARVRTPASWEVLRAEPSSLVVLEHDEYGVEVVRVYGLSH